MNDYTYIIIKNSARCCVCETEIESKHRHDYVSCPCGNLSVDGGTDYLKRSVSYVNKYDDTSIVESTEGEYNDKG